MQIENADTSITPPTPASPVGEAQSPEGQASSFSSGSSDTVNGNFYLLYFILLLW